MSRKITWIEAIKVDYFLGVDGISLPLVILTAVMAPIAMLASFGVERRVKMHYALLFLLEAAMLGYFVALNFFFFFIFWEFSLVPAYFIIQTGAATPSSGARRRRSNSSSTPWPARSACCCCSSSSTWRLRRRTFRPST